MKKGLRPVSESFEYLGILILFLVAWLADGYFTLTGESGQLDTIYLMIGAMILGFGVVRIYQAYKNRMENKRLREELEPTVGIIKRVIFQEDTRGMSLQDMGRSKKRPKYFFLEIETPDIRGVNKIESDGYVKPIHKYLKSDKVLVYYDETTGKKTIGGIEWKDPKEPDVITFDGKMPNMAFRNIALAIIAASILFVLFALYWVHR